jgi:hypothetical protein
MCLSVEDLPREYPELSGVYECADLLTQEFNVSSDIIREKCLGAHYVNDNLLQLYPFLSTISDGITKRWETNSRRSAVNYAIRYATQGNPSYPWVFNNCTNFVSQVLEAGGLRQELSWTMESNSAPYLTTCVEGGVKRALGNFLVSGFQSVGGMCGPAWVITPDLERFLIGDPPAHQFTYVDVSIVAGGDISYNGTGTISPGDIVIFHVNGINSEASHAAAIIGWGPPASGARPKRQLTFNAGLIPWIADNSGPGYIRPLNDIGQSQDARIIHILYP